MSDAAEYIEFVEDGFSDSGKTRRWIVRNKRHRYSLGKISWHGPWRQYVFEPVHMTVFAPDCLLEISVWCRSATELHKSKTKENPNEPSELGPKPV